MGKKQTISCSASLDASLIKKYTSSTNVASKSYSSESDTDEQSDESVQHKSQAVSTSRHLTTLNASSDSLCINSSTSTEVVGGAEGLSSKNNKGRLRNGNCFYKRDTSTYKGSSPLSELYCSGQRVEFKGENAFLPVSEAIATSNASGAKSTKPRQKETHTVAINKLYSSLKRLKNRHDSISKEDINLKCSSFPFNNNRNFVGQSRLPNSEIDGEEDIFILLGGKSKPVRFEVNPKNIHLLESEFAMNLKSKSSCANLDKEDLELVKRFRDKYRTGHNGSPCLPWSRHSVCRKSTCPEKNTSQRRSSSEPSATYDIEEEDFGRKLSIHVYLPNIFPGNTSTES